jgi:hypothetical protein
MRRISVAAAVLIAFAGSACSAPSEPGTPPPVVARLDGAVLTGSSASLSAPNYALRLQADVPAGTHVISLDLGASPVRDLQFSFTGGSNDLRIRRVQGVNCASLDTFFADATTHFATTYFDAHPVLFTESRTWLITVENLDTRTRSLHLTARFTADATTPPCGL